MGDRTITGWIEKLATEIPLIGPVLEVGSLREPNSQDFFDYRPLFPDGIPYLGVDMAPGLGVDYVCDVSEPEALRSLGPFNTILSTCTLEHVRDPWRCAEEMAALLNPGGHLVISAPFAWVLHNYPDDYWRFTPSGIRALFPSITFDLDRSCMTTCSGRTVQLSDTNGMRALEYIGIRYGAAGHNGEFLTPIFLVQPGSLVSEGVNVNMVGYA